MCEWAIHIAPLDWEVCQDAVVHIDVQISTYTIVVQATKRLNKEVLTYLFISNDIIT